MTRKLDASYASFKLQLGSHEYAKQAAIRPTVTAELLNQLGLPDLVGMAVKNRSRQILEYFSRANEQIRCQGFIHLVASFESDLFKLLEQATSNVRHVLNEHYKVTYPFWAYRKTLARTTEDFSNLGGYKRLLAVTSSSATESRRDLWDVVSHRDFLVHGERWRYPANPPTMDSAYKILSNELDQVAERKE